MKKTHCKRGHALEGDNLYVYPNGKRRQCKTCKADHNKRNPLAYRKDIENTKKQNLERKIRVLTHYGPDGRLGCCWVDCLIIDVDMLSLDHIHNDGASHRNALNKGAGRGKGGRSVYRDVEKRNFPSGFQTLCFNHQMKKQLTRNKH